VFFLTIVIGGYWLMGHRAQNIFLLLASYYFYGYVYPWFLYLIIASTVVDYSCGLAIVRYPQRKKLFLGLSLVTNLGLLGVFKYFGFFVDNFILLLTELGLPSFTNTISIMLPVGISFYTFQTLSYTIDVYWGKIAPRRNFVDFALYVSFFPQLVAGPIERAKRLLTQIEQKRVYNHQMIREGIFLIVWGFFKKLVIADNVAVIANMVFALENPSFYILWAGVFAFTIQIFSDFSAYTDIARGSAKLLGINLSPNFNHPFIAISPADFWSRWHMSLSSWIRDYVFTPVTYYIFRKYRNPVISNQVGILITFLLIGFWHGPSWNFILFGLYFSIIYIIFYIVMRMVPLHIRKKPALQPFRMILMFVLFNISMLIFRGGELVWIWHYFNLSPFGVDLYERQLALFLFSKALL
jgi:alginate O-acetyltransferase complex protein AlgI